MRLRARVHSTSSALIGEKGGAGQSLLRTSLQGPTDGVCECKMDVKSTWIYSDMASNGSCFMVTWIVFKNRHLEVGTIQIQETMALWTLITVKSII
jgi:hypothetical protein